MTASAPFAPLTQIRRSADWGGKALLVCALALLMAIPGVFVFSLVAERSHRADSVIKEVSALRGGAQQLLGPLFVAPYVVVSETGAVKSGGWYVVSPTDGTVTITVKSATLHRGIFDVPVYDGTADVRAVFGPLPKTPILPAAARVDWNRGSVVIGFSDLRGARSDVTGSFSDSSGKSALAFVPASTMDLGNAATPTKDRSEVGGSFGIISAASPALVSSPTGGAFAARVRFTGAQRLSVMPFAKATHVVIAGDWPSPSFDGAFLPETRQIKDGTFTAGWNVPFLARGLSDQGGTDALSLTSLGKKDVGVTFARANNPYENVTRSLKYGVMFVGLVFLTFFVFEALSGQRLHPAQYVLIGLAQMVFYLLLLSLSEYMGFDVGFACAATATVGLIGLYAGWAFKSARYRVRALIIFGLLYLLIYGLMRLEDFALLAGSIASFVGLSVAMYLTRNIEWYGGRPAPSAATPASNP